MLDEKPRSPAVTLANRMSFHVPDFRIIDRVVATPRRHHNVPTFWIYRQARKVTHDEEYRDWSRTGKECFSGSPYLPARKVQFRKKLTRKQFSTFMAKRVPCLVILEASGSVRSRVRSVARHFVNLHVALAPKTECILTAVSAGLRSLSSCAPMRFKAQLSGIESGQGVFQRRQPHQSYH